MNKEEVVKKDTDESEPDVQSGKIKVKVYAPFRNYFEGLADSLSAINDTGPFDILPGHHKFLTLLSPCDIIVRVEGEKDEAIEIEKGVMFVQDNRVSVFLDV